jgi:hypothetical protein
LVELITQWVKSLQGSLGLITSKTAGGVEQQQEVLVLAAGGLWHLNISPPQCFLLLSCNAVGHAVALTSNIISGSALHAAAALATEMS